ncbi:MAG: hypothetical protein ACE5FG_12910 [Myxococcota bacterium]
MQALVQNFVTDTVLGAFDATGSYLGDVLVLPHDASPNTGAGVPWLMGTAEFAALSGITPECIIPAGLPIGAGMVCWGSPPVGFVVPPLGSWDHSNPQNYVDCVAYGGYSGPTPTFSGSPLTGNADGHSLTRVSDTDDNASDFVCADPAAPENNSRDSATLAATTACSGGGPVPLLPRGGLALLLAVLAVSGATHAARRVRVLRRL